MKQKIIITFLFVSMVFISLLNGQDYKATTKLDTNHILIGDYLNIHLEVTAPLGKMIIIPQLSQQLLEQNETPFDWIQNSKVDTSQLASEVIFHQTITITAFDSGIYIFPSIPILSVDSQLLAQTEPLLFKVSTVAVDTTMAFRDIKGNVKTFLSLHEIFLYLKKYTPYILLAAIIIGVVIYFIIRYLKRTRKTPPTIVKPKIKPHITALKALEKLRHKKLWEQGRIKEYYSELTDIIRIYMENKWDIYAMEMVSTEIIEELRKMELSEELIDKMQSTFTVADLVKFAKWNPLPSEHDIAFKNIFSFVHETAEKPQENSIKNESKII